MFKEGEVEFEFPMKRMKEVVGERENFLYLGEKHFGIHLKLSYLFSH